MHVQKVVDANLREIGQHSFSGLQILGPPAADGRVKGSASNPRGHVDF